ncbi:nuclease-related domain-containing DEAD/DEAH box helicase [Hymenobacter perfusus]|nr:NERD domain-containing protein [Hymenobacter perfusus]
MYPPVVPGDAPPGEKTVFRMLRDDPDTIAWTVLHSLDLARHHRRLTGEIDFVVIVPGQGILCIEVKSHEEITVSQGQWEFGKARERKLSPFKQVSEGMHTLRKYIAQRQPDLAAIPLCSAVAFPQMGFDLRSPEWEPWQVIDAHGIRLRGLRSWVLDNLSHIRRRIRDRGIPGFDIHGSEPTRRQCDRLVQLLRPDFEVFRSPELRRLESEEQVLHYTQVQMKALDAMADNPRVLFNGPAGTGKTMLAIEAVRRALLEGKKVLFVCYNRFLGSYLERQFGDQNPALTVGTFHRFLMRVAQIPAGGAAGRNDDFWKQQLPQQALDALLSVDATGAAKWQYDLLVVDEFQDLLVPLYLDILDLCLSQGLVRGKWLFFGDFAQNIYQTDTADMESLRDLRPDIMWSPYRLLDNCRNTPRIGAFVQKYSGLKPGYASHLRPDDGQSVDPDMQFYSNAKQQINRLSDILSELLSVHYQPQDIVILSPLGQESCAATVLAGQQEWAERLQFGAPGKVNDRVAYTTIQSFKGMEAPVVVVTDIRELEGQQGVALFYIAASRARNQLFLLMDEKVSPGLIKALKLR